MLWGPSVLGRAAHTFTAEAVRRGIAWLRAWPTAICAGCSHGSCLNTSGEVLSCGIRHPGAAFHLPWGRRADRNLLHLLVGCAGASCRAGVCHVGWCRRVLRCPGLCWRRNLSPPCPAEQPWR